MIKILSGIILSLIGLAVYCGGNPFLWLWYGETFHRINFLFVTCITCVAIVEWIRYH